MKTKWNSRCALLAVIAGICTVDSIVAAAKAGKKCSFPGAAWHAKLESQLKEFPDGTTVKYVCDRGYTIVGRGTRRCRNGEWKGALPECLRELAEGKEAYFLPPNVNTKPNEASDDDPHSCALSHKDSAMPVWGVDLLEKAEIDRVTLSLGLPIALNISIEVRVGDKHPTNAVLYNRICSTRTFDVVFGDRQTFTCSKPIRGRYVSVHVINHKSRLSLCDVQAYSRSSLAVDDVCSNLRGLPNVLSESFGHRCVGILRNKTKNIQAALKTCTGLGGRVLEDVDTNLQAYINWKMAKHFPTDSDISIWMGAERDKNTTRGWRWFNRKELEEEVSDTKQSGKHCLALEGVAWRAASCDEPRYAVCVLAPSRCGSLPVPEMAANPYSLDPVPVKLASEVRCEEKFYLANDEIRCFANGSISQTDPICLPFTCPLTLQNGTISRLNGTNQASLKCNEGFILAPAGSSKLRCVDGEWSSLTPICVEDTKTGQMISDALDGVREIGESLHNIPYLGRVPARVLDRIIMITVILSAIMAVVTLALIGYFVYRRRRIAVAQVTNYNARSAKTGVS